MSEKLRNNSSFSQSTFHQERLMKYKSSGIIAIHSTGEIKGIDATAAQFIGTQPQSARGKNILEFIPQFTLPVKVSGGEMQGEVQIQLKDQINTLFYQINPGGDASEEFYFVLLQHGNSTDQGISRFQEIFEWLPTGLLIYDIRNQRSVTCNQHLLKTLELQSRAEALNPENPFSLSLKAAFADIPEDKPASFQIHLTRPGAQYLCLEATTKSIPTLDEHLLLVLLRDITQQDRNAKDLKENRNTLEAIIGNAVDGIIIIDHRGSIQMTNEATVQLFGYSKEEMLGQNIKMLMPQPHRGAHDGYLSNYMSSGQGKIIGVGREVQGQRKNGDLFPFRLGVSRIETENGLLFTGVIHDLTEEHKAKEEIISLNRELEQKVEERTEKLTEVVNKLLQSNLKLEEQIKERKAAEEALRNNEVELKKALEREKELSELKSRFVSMASHEFRTPLTTIASSSELIKFYTETDQQPKREKHLRRIQSAVTNLTGILGDFLSLSKLEEGKISNIPSPVNLQELLDESVDDVHVLMKTGQSIDQDFEHLDQTVLVDKKILKNVMLNLLSNAIKYSGKGSTVWLKAKMADGMLNVSIRDEGIGIPESDQKHLFSRFFRADNAVNIQGTGLGLNIVQRYLELLKGKIDFESEEGKGTTFFFEIPL